MSLSLSPRAAYDAPVPGPGDIRLLAALRRVGGWLLLSGWVVLALLPVVGLGLSVLLGVGLF